MSLQTFSAFYYGHEVTSENNLIDFNEGGPDFIAEIDVGTYTLTQYAQAVQNALNDAGSNIYVVTLDRSTRTLTVSADNNFELLVATGVSTGTSAFPMMGFSGADRTGTDTYEGNLASGSAYYPQFILQDHIPQANFKRTVQAAVNESASGDVEIVRFGSVRFTQFNIMFITDLPMDDLVIKNNPTGVDDANAFMNYITKIAPIEFMPDISDLDTFEILKLESTPESKDGIDYTLKEEVQQKIPRVFRTGILVFRVLG